MSTNRNTKTYWRRASRLAHRLAFELAFGRSGKSANDVIAAVDPRAPRALRRDAIEMAVVNCGQMAHHLTGQAAQYRGAQAALQDYREPVSLRVIDGGAT